MDDLELLPDFDDMERLIKECTTAKAKLEDAKNKLSEEIARCINEAMVNEKYWINGKPPSMAYCTAVVAMNGNTEDDKAILSSLRKSIVESELIYQETKRLLDAMNSRIEIWRTHSANKRKALA